MTRRKNGVVEFDAVRDDPGAGVGAVSQLISDELKFAAGDYLEVRVRQTSGGNLDFVPNSFTLSWVAPG